MAERLNTYCKGLRINELQIDFLKHNQDSLTVALIN